MHAREGRLLLVSGGVEAMASAVSIGLSSFLGGSGAIGWGGEESSDMVAEIGKVEASCGEITN